MIKIEAISKNQANISICGTEENIRFEIRALLDALEQSSDFLELFSSELDNRMKRKGMEI